MSGQFKTALIRGFIWSVILAGGSFFGQLSTGGTYKAAWIAAGVVFFLSLATRTGIEGYIDTQAASPSKAPSGQSGRARVLAVLVASVLLSFGLVLGHGATTPVGACGPMNYVYNYGNTYTVNVWFTNQGQYHHVNLRTDVMWDGCVTFAALTWEWTDSPNTFATEGTLVARTGGGNAGGGARECYGTYGNYGYCWGIQAYGNSAWADDYDGNTAWIGNPYYWSPPTVSGYTHS